VSTSGDLVGKNPTRGQVPNQNPTSETPAKSGNYGILVGLVEFFSGVKTQGARTHTGSALSWSGSSEKPDHEIRPASEKPDHETTADVCYATVKVALDRIDALAAGQPAQIKRRLGDLVAEYVSVLARAAADSDSEVARCVALDLERDARDLIAGRGYDFEPPEAVCMVCNRECRWCATIAIVRCGACFPRAGARPANRLKRTDA